MSDPTPSDAQPVALDETQAFLLAEALECDDDDMPVSAAHYRRAADAIAALDAERQKREAAERDVEAADASLAKANATIDRLTTEGLYISEQFSGAAGDIVKLRARIAELEAGWQPVETAPANRAILIHLPNRDYYGNDGVYAGMLVDMGTGRRWMTFGWAMGRDCDEPDGWMPMPPAALTNIEKERDDEA